MAKKKWYESKTFWVNMIALWAMICQAVIGYELFDLEAQAGILAFINLVLRIITKIPIVWK